MKCAVTLCTYSCKLTPKLLSLYSFQITIFIGGATKNEPILVSRVAINTPADKCHPRLNEGDQVLQINGQDVSHSLHNVVVQLIQEARKTEEGKILFCSILIMEIIFILLTFRKININSETKYSLQH